MVTPQTTSSRTRLFLDSSGAALERMLGEARPALWMRGAERLPELSEAKLLAQVSGAGPALLSWSVSRVTDDPDRSFRHFRELSALRVGEGELEAMTGLGRFTIPSQIDIADGTNCSPETFKQFVSTSTFGILSGVLFGPVSKAQSCIPILSRTLGNWHVNSGTAGERDLLTTVAELRAQFCAPVICIVDSDMRHFWAILLDEDTAIAASGSSALFATSEEFARWERIGWDVRSLNRSSP
jgi:hypothetical protein